MREFDVVVMGAGAPGEVAAGRLGQNGLSVAIVEESLVGGDCSFYACMPSKALLRPVELANEVERVPGLEARADRQCGGARPARRGDPQPRRQFAAALARAAQRHARARARPDQREAAGRRRGPGDAHGAPRRCRRDRLHRDRARHPRSSRCAAVDEPQRHDGARGAAAARNSRRRRRRCRDGPGLGRARFEGDIGAPRAALDRARGAVRGRAGARVAARARRGRPPRSIGKRTSRATARSRSRSTTARASRSTSCWWRSAAPPEPPGSASRCSGSRPASRCASARICASRVTTGCSRSATSTAVPCSPTWASTRAGWRRTHLARRSSCAPTAGNRRA